MKIARHSAWGVLTLALMSPGARGEESRARCHASPGAADAVRARLEAVEAEALTADYRADLGALAKLRNRAGDLVSDPQWGYLAHYWSGFASWRSAINGTSKGMSEADLRGNLEHAAAEFEAAVAACGDFADALGASGGVHGWLARFHKSEPDEALKDTVLYFMRTRRAVALEPDNPRVLWTDASIDLFVPGKLGGDASRAIRTYRRMVELTARGEPNGAWPDWGRPEAYMSLAFAHANQTPPDLKAAFEAAQEALRLRPDWSYVKNILLPQIEKAKAEAAATASATKGGRGS